MGTLRVVSPTESQLVAVAELRFDWAVSDGHVPIEDKRAFTDGFLTWTRVHDDSHRCLVVTDADDKVQGRSVDDVPGGRQQVGVRQSALVDAT